MRGAGRSSTSEPLQTLRWPESRPRPARRSCRAGTSFLIGEFHLALLRPPGSVAQRLENIVALEIGIVREEIFNCAAGADLPDDHPDRDAQSTNARLAAHDGGVLGNSREIVHGCTVDLIAHF